MKHITTYYLPDNIGGGVLRRSITQNGLRRKEDGTGLTCLSSLISVEGGQRRKSKDKLIDSIGEVTL